MRRRPRGWFGAAAVLLALSGASVARADEQQAPHEVQRLLRELCAHPVLAPFLESGLTANTHGSRDSCFVTLPQPGQPGVTGDLLLSGERRFNFRHDRRGPALGAFERALGDGWRPELSIGLLERGLIYVDFKGPQGGGGLFGRQPFDFVSVAFDHGVDGPRSISSISCYRNLPRGIQSVATFSTMGRGGPWRVNVKEPRVSAGGTLRGHVFEGPRVDALRWTGTTVEAAR